MTRVKSRRIEGLGILRGHTQGSVCEARRMKIWSTPHSDMGNRVNYNGPKVDPRICVPGTAPTGSDSG